MCPKCGEYTVSTRDGVQCKNSKCGKRWVRLGFRYVEVV